MAATELGLARYERPAGGGLLAAHRRGGARAPRRRVGDDGELAAAAHRSVEHDDLTPMPAAEPDAVMSARRSTASRRIISRSCRFPCATDGTSRSSIRASRRRWPSSTAPLAERLFGGERGRQAGSRRTRRRAIEIVGVVEDGKYTAIGEQRRAAIFCPLTQRYANSSMLIVRSSPPGAVTAEDLRRLIHRVDPSAADSHVGHRRANYGVAAAALPRRGGRARPARGDRERLLLSGLHAMLAYAVVKRQREIGIRIALGADRVSRGRARCCRA